MKLRRVDIFLQLMQLLLSDFFEDIFHFIVFFKINKIQHFFHFQLNQILPYNYRNNIYIFVLYLKLPTAPNIIIMFYLFNLQTFYQSIILTEIKEAAQFILQYGTVHTESQINCCFANGETCRWCCELAGKARSLIKLFIVILVNLMNLKI